MYPNLYHHTSQDGTLMEYASVEIPGETWLEIENQPVQKTILEASLLENRRNEPLSPSSEPIISIHKYLKVRQSSNPAAPTGRMLPLDPFIRAAMDLGYDHLMLLM